MPTNRFLAFNQPDDNWFANRFGTLQKLISEEAVNSIIYLATGFIYKGKQILLTSGCVFCFFI